MDRSVNFNSLGTPTQFGAGDEWYVQDTKALWVFKKGYRGPDSIQLSVKFYPGSVPHLM